MTDYVDGFVHPIPSVHLPAYRRLVEAVAKIWLEHGALEYREFVGDELEHEGTASFPDLLAAKEDEIVVFGWVAFASHEARDRANEKVAVDPRVAELMSSIDAGFDAERMAYGGFRPLLT